jgi:Mrp family chromosome partitioning ATPase
VDTPPVLSISDPLYISSLADATVMVVAWRSTPQAYVDEAVRTLRAAGAPLAGIVLNKVSRTVNDPSRSLYYDRRYVTA